MEPAGAWGGPCEFQLATTTNYWYAEEPAPAQVWAAGLPVDYASMGDMFVGGTCSGLQAYVPESSFAQQQLVEYNYYAAAVTTQHDDHHLIIGKEAAAQEELDEDDHHKTTDLVLGEYKRRPMKLFQEKADNFRMDILGAKMHRYPSPPVMPDFGKWYKEPCVVAIGPYHHGLDHLKQAEEVKHVAACNCILESRESVEELYGAVISAVRKTSHRYDMADDIGKDDVFLPMMFYDACFLVQCMVWYTTDPSQMDPSLVKFFAHNYAGIRHDITLLENQIPWGVVEAVLNLRKEPIDLERFVALWKDSLQDRKASMENLPRGFLDTKHHTREPHLLGLLRFYIVGKSSNDVSASKSVKVESLSFSASPVELAEMGIRLKAMGKTTELARMGFEEKWYSFFFADLSLPPLALTEARASRLLNMAAHEVCATTDFFSDRAKDEESAVCSYLRVLCMLVHREEDVHQLRARGILQGAGLTNAETLEFLAKFEGLPHGPCYARVMDGIDQYRARKGPLIVAHRFLYRHIKIILAVGSIIGTLAGFLSNMKSFIKS